MLSNLKEILMIAKTKLKKKFKNKFFRRRLVLYIVCLLIIILILTIAIKNGKRKKYENRIKKYEETVFGTLEEEYANITKYYSYGTHFHVEGTINNISKDNYESVSLLISNENDTKEFSISGSLTDNILSFTSGNQLNKGIYLDELSNGRYYIKVKVVLNNSNKPKI